MGCVLYQVIGGEIKIVFMMKLVGKSVFVSF